MRFRMIALAMGLALIGCNKETATVADEPAVERLEKGHAAEGAKPGTHEDWCEEHQVPESQCTRCNPTLVAAFKATGDWCDEHGLPESQCLKCNPELVIVRPPKSEAN